MWKLSNTIKLEGETASAAQALASPGCPTEPDDPKYPAPMLRNTLVFQAIISTSTAERSANGTSRALRNFGIASCEISRWTGALTLLCKKHLSPLRKSCVCHLE